MAGASGSNVRRTKLSRTKSAARRKDFKPIDVNATFNPDVAPF